MRNIYLVDFENVGSDGLSGILNLTSEDRVIIFYSTHSNRLTMRAHILIGRAAAQFTYYEATVGAKNALDHQLSTYLGYLIGSNAAERYYIVSKDNGYRYASNFWNELLKQTAVFCIDSIRNAPRITERMLRRRQAETTLRTAEDLHDDDLDEGTGEQSETVYPEFFDTGEPESAESFCTELSQQPDDGQAMKAALSDQQTAEPEAREPKNRQTEPEHTENHAEALPHMPADASDSASIPDSASSSDPQSAQAAPAPQQGEQIRSVSCSEESAADVTPQIPQVLFPGMTGIPALPAPAADSTALTSEILFPENDIDDVPDPNRPVRSTGRRQQNWQENRNRHNRRNGSGQRNEDTRKNASDTADSTDGKTGGSQPKAASSQQGSDTAVPPVQGESRHARSQRSRQNDHSAQNSRSEKNTEDVKNTQKTKQHDTRSDNGRSSEKSDRPDIQTDKSDSYDWLIPLLAPYPKLSADRIREMVAGKQKQILCNSLRKQLGQEKGLALYSEIKKAAWK